MDGPHDRRRGRRALVGHGLDNDFKVLGINHPRHLVRDTAHDFQRYLTPRGRPRKLRHITYEFLGLRIQDGEHDPCEDARAALYLYLRYRDEFEAAAVRHEAELEAKMQAKEARRAAESVDASTPAGGGGQGGGHDDAPAPPGKLKAG